MCEGVISIRAFRFFRLISTITLGQSIIISKEIEVQREEVKYPGPYSSGNDKAKPETLVSLIPKFFVPQPDTSVVVVFRVGLGSFAVGISSQMLL